MQCRHLQASTAGQGTEEGSLVAVGAEAGSPGREVDIEAGAVVDVAVGTEEGTVVAEAGRMLGVVIRRGRRGMNEGMKTAMFG